jgi:hypothetical protein
MPTRKIKNVTLRRHKIKKFHMTYKPMSLIVAAKFAINYMILFLQNCPSPSPEE